ncbi:MAG: S-methyl-5-thioribose-1-phosphate isomerase [Lachnospiraceae bacterium]|nr:S-methyl-5-thioribose-1-phosphate isomerase [Lachnospiraceae bacterium]
MLKDYDTLWLDEELREVKYIDQTRLPNELVIKSIQSLDDMYRAIVDLEVRGAPAIGVFAALSMYVLSVRIGGETLADFVREYIRCSDYLQSARPTAVNLSWAVLIMRKELERYTLHRFDSYLLDSRLEGIKLDDELRGYIGNVMHAKALEIYENDINVCKCLGQNGLQVIKNGDRILTHCNAGRLATVRYGTATAPIYLANESGMNISVYCDETRPLLQGARLTAYELKQSGIKTTLLCDNMAASLMSSGKIDKVLVGCDRVAANGDVANKIGTLSLAIMAKHFGIPFYVCAPTSSIDLNVKSGDKIIIETRNPSEVTTKWYKNRMAPEGVDVFNPAFDITNNELITAIITERGIACGDYTNTLASMFE